jgi:hypothetical protein
VRALSSGNVDAVLAPESQARESCEPWQGIQDFLRTAFVCRPPTAVCRRSCVAASLAPPSPTRRGSASPPVVSQLVIQARNAGQLPADVGPGDLVLAELMVGARRRASRTRRCHLAASPLNRPGRPPRRRLIATTPDGFAIDRLQGC